MVDNAPSRAQQLITKEQTRDSEFNVKEPEKKTATEDDDNGHTEETPQEHSSEEEHVAPQEGELFNSRLEITLIL